MYAGMCRSIASSFNSAFWASTPTDKTTQPSNDRAERMHVPPKNVLRGDYGPDDCS
jgi:hypothetical protein